MASPDAYNSNQVATSDDYVMTSLASSRPGQAKTSASPSTARTSNAEAQSTSAVIYGPRNALSPSGGGGGGGGAGQQPFLLYYCYGELVVRPIGLFTGDISSEYARVVPYLLRRSNGQIRWLQYDSSDYLMVSDLKLVMEVDVALQNTANIIIKARENAQVYVYGEVAGGFSFGADSKLELIGFLYFAKWTKSGLGEEAINRSCIIDFTDGVANVFLCDYKEVVLMVDDNVKYQLILHEDELGAQMTVPPEQLSPRGKTESIAVARLDLVPQPQTESVTPTKVSSSSTVSPITTQESLTFASIVKRMDNKTTNQFEEQEQLQSRCKSTAKVSKAQVKDKGKKSTEVVAPKDVIISKSIKVVDNPKAIEVLRKVSDRLLPPAQKVVKKASMATTSQDGSSKRKKSKSPVESKVISPKSETTTSVSAFKKFSPMVTVIKSPGPSKPFTTPTDQRTVDQSRQRGARTEGKGHSSDCDAAQNDQ